MFPKGWRNETQIIAMVHSNDKQKRAGRPRAHRRVGGVDHLGHSLGGPDRRHQGRGGSTGKLIPFPTFDQQQGADINLTVAVSRDAIVMVEGGALQVPEGGDDRRADVRMGVGPAAHRAAGSPAREGGRRKAPLCRARGPTRHSVPRCRPRPHDSYSAALQIVKKHERSDAVRAAKKEIVAKFAESHPDREDEVKEALSKLEKKIVRTRVLDTGVRIDGRGTTDVRPLHIEAHPYARPHGSALFQRGETQALATCTLGTEYDAQRLDTIRGDVRRTFLLHYNFPPFCTGEARPMRGTSRRETGHGKLAERALSAVVPSVEDFPYTIRIVSDILESNGSSSMASVCGGCLALMDAGVPVKAPVAGIAMGLMQDGEKIAVLTDILGDEDHMGDMDFKVTGSKEGITALQMDIKIEGLSRKILEDALSQARDARLHILEAMHETLPEPRKDLSRYAPRVETIQVKVDRIRDIIGPGGKMIRAIVEQSGAQINVDDAGRVSIASDNPESIEKAKKLIEGLTAEAEIGAVYQGIVTRVADFGAFVEILPGTDGLCHISELENKRVGKVTDVLNEGDEVVVKVLNIDQQGRIRLSRKAAFGVDPSDVQNMRA